MRFILFNIVVGLSLVYLINGGQMPVGGFKEGLAQAQQAAAHAAAKMKRNLVVSDAPAPSSERQSEPEGHARDVIPEPKAEAPEAPPKPAAPRHRTQTSPPPPPAPSAETANAVPDLPTAKTVAVRPRHTINEADAQVAKRRAEVLATSSRARPAAKVSLKEGTSLMSAAERRRQLDDLAEEMEMLYLEKVGG